MASHGVNGDDYFGSYSDLHVHELMLKDRPRTVAYRRFFEENREFVKGKVVMDVGAGTGILSLFAATAGAKKVYAVEASNVALLCQEIITENNLDAVIDVIHEKVENVTLPEDTQVDIIVSEWMGFYLLHESMLDSVIYARDKFLAPSGILVPSSAFLYVAPVDMSQHFEERAEYWSNVYGFDFSPIASSLNISDISQPLIKCLDQNCVKCPELKLLDLNLRTVTVEEVKSFCKTVEFSINEDARIHGFAFWFDVLFETENQTSKEYGISLKESEELNQNKDDTNLHSDLNSVDYSGDAKHIERVNITQKYSKASNKETSKDFSICVDDKTTVPSSLVNSTSSKTSVSSSVSSVRLPTGPSDPPTHWKQTIVFLPQTIMVLKGISVLCKIKMAQDSSNKRLYNITLELGDGNEIDVEQENKSDSEDCSVDEESDDSTGHPTPCFCGSTRCRLISALIEKYDIEHQELEDEAENIETEAEVEAAKEIDAQIEHEGWPMDSSNVEGGDV